MSMGLSARDRRMIALKADVSDSTMYRFLAGKELRPAIRNAIKQAIADLGLEAALQQPPAKEVA